LIDLSVPGITVKIREVPRVSAGPTARLCTNISNFVVISDPEANYEIVFKAL
jgi:hypothetical protein